MKYIVLLILGIFGLTTLIKGQTRAELEDQRKKTLSEIVYVDNLLKTTEKQKTQNINAIKIIGNKLTLREIVIKGMQAEISLLTERIELNRIAIVMMEEDLIELRRDYARVIINSYRSQKGNPELIYILSARDFNQGYKRLKYLQQIAKFRRQETEIILELKEQIETSKEKLQSDLNRMSDIKSKEEEQKNLLKGEQERKQRMLRSLSTKERQLRREWEEKKKIAKKIEDEIARVIEEERRRAIIADNTPEQKLIGDNFIVNKGRLPWPVEKGIITSHFGVQKHPVLKYLTDNNIGIEITSIGKMNARAVFQGEVVRIAAIPGANMTVIIQHGKYRSVYTNIVNVKVKQGDKVVTKQIIGDVYSDPSDNNNSILKFMICLEIKYLDPEQWISKN